MAGEKDRRTAGMKSAYKWYALAAIALAGNMYFEREAVTVMTRVQAAQGTLTAAFESHIELPAHAPVELRLQRDEMAIEDIAQAVEEVKQSTDDFMDTVNTNFIAIQTQLHISALISEKRDVVDRTEQLERVVERMEVNSEVVPLIYRQNLKEKRQRLVELNSTIAGLQIP